MEMEQKHQNVLLYDKGNKSGHLGNSVSIYNK